MLRTLVVDGKGEVLEHHEMAKFRTQVATQTLAPREAQAVRYAFDVPAHVAVPLTVTARLRHRSRTLAMQRDLREARTPQGQAFIAGARGARESSSTRASRSRSRSSRRRGSSSAQART